MDKLISKITNVDLAEEGLAKLPKENWLYQYLGFTNSLESPSSFHVWTGLSTISSVLNRRVWMPRDTGYNLYPNQYIIVVAESAYCRKSTAIEKARDSFFVDEHLINIIQDSMTPQMLTKELCKEQMINPNFVLIFVTELATFFGADSFKTGIIPLLTSLYTCPSLYVVKTKTAGNDIIKQPCINLLGATTLDWMATNLPADAIEGGFTGRVMFIVGDRPRLTNPFGEAPAEEKSLRPFLFNDLSTRMRGFQGGFKWTEEGRELFKNWYTKRMEEDDTRLRGYAGRKQDHVLKIAMCLSSGDFHRVSKEDLKIEEWHISTALTILKKAEVLMPKAFRGGLYSKQSKHFDRVIDIMKRARRRGKNYPLPYHKMLQSISRYVNTKELKEILGTLIEQRTIERGYSAKGGEVYSLLKD